MLTQTHREAHEQHKKFHAGIAARAVKIKATKTFRKALVSGTPEISPQRVQTPKYYDWRQAFGVPFQRRGQGNIKIIQIVVCDFYGVRREDLISRRRPLKLVKPRWVAAYLAKQMTMCSLAEIGRVFRRDHTSIHHAIEMFEKNLERDSILASEVADLRSKLEDDHGV